MNRKSIFITGGANGIGAATARLFAQKGWFIGIGDIDEHGMQRMIEELGAEKIYCCKMDVTKVESVKKAFEAFGQQTKGHIDLLLNNAGILHAGRFEDISLAQHAQLVQINIFGMINCTHQAIPYLVKGQSPTIINMASASALYGIPNLAVYSSSKFAVKGLTEALEIELSKKGIRVCDVLPKFVQTAMTASISKAALDLEKEKNILTPEFIASQVWAAAHSRRIHRYVGLQLKFFSLLTGILPQRLSRRIAIIASNYV